MRADRGRCAVAGRDVRRIDPARAAVNGLCRTGRPTRSSRYSTVVVVR